MDMLETSQTLTYRQYLYIKRLIEAAAVIGASI
jgi:hypothetical protein